MSFKRKILMSLAAVTLPVSTGLFILGSGSASAVTKYDNSTDTVSCGSIVLGKVTIQPALAIGGTQPTTIKVSGKLFGCTDGLGNLNAKGNTLAPDFEGVFSGTLAGTSNNVTSLSGCSASSGTIVLTWLATAGATEPLLWPHTTVTVDHIDGSTLTPSDAPYGTDNLSTDGYGAFELGKVATTAGGGSCSTSTSESGTQGFQGGDGGVASSTYAVTQQDFSVFLENQENNATQTTSTINLSIGTAYFG